MTDADFAALVERCKVTCLNCDGHGRLGVPYHGYEPPACHACAGAGRVLPPGVAEVVAECNRLRARVRRLVCREHLEDYGGDIAVPAFAYMGGQWAGPIPEPEE